MSGKGKNKLIAYIERIQGKIAGIESSGDAMPPEEAAKVVPHVVLSVKRLCAAAPAELRKAIHDALEAKGCLESEVSLATLSEGLVAVAEVLGVPEEVAEAFAAGEGVAPPPPPVDVQPGDEAAELTGVVNRLWDMEQPYRLVPGNDLTLNMQNKAADLETLTGGSPGAKAVDRAPVPLFAHVDTSKFSELDRAFIALLDNYNPHPGQQETMTREERAEIDRFLDLLHDTPHLRYVHNVLVKWELAPEKMRDFIALVYEAWFATYYHGTSSGFEHVFVGEQKKNHETGASEIVGMHNWIQFQREERLGGINYLGYAHKGTSDGLLINVRFAWEERDGKEEVKNMSTFLVGTSIAFDFALATLVYVGGKDGDRPWISIGGHDCRVQLYKVTERMGTYMRSVFLEA